MAALRGDIGFRYLKQFFLVVICFRASPLSQATQSFLLNIYSEKKYLFTFWFTFFLIISLYRLANDRRVYVCI